MTVFAIFNGAGRYLSALYATRGTADVEAEKLRVLNPRREWWVEELPVNGGDSIWARMSWPCSNQLTSNVGQREKEK